jgi:hypothetical protein
MYMNMQSLQASFPIPQTRFGESTMRDYKNNKVDLFTFDSRSTSTEEHQRLVAAVAITVAWGAWSR